MNVHCFAVGALSAVFATAQTPPCISANDTTTSVSTAVTAYGFSGPGVRAWQFTPAQTTVLFGAELFTSNTFLTAQGYMTLEVWDDAAGLPGQRIAGGTFQVDGSLGDDWRGANFDGAAALNGGQDYWLVWIEPGFSTIPTDPTGVTMPAATLQGGTWSSLSPSALKWRGYCSPLDRAGVQALGLGCPSPSGPTPTAFTNRQPTVGNADFTIEGCGMPAGAIGLMALGIDPTWPAVPVPGAPGCQVHTDASATLLVTTGTGNQRANHPPSGPGFDGHVRFGLPIPTNPALAGVYINAQFAIFDAAATTPLPFVFSNGLGITIQ